MSGSLLRIGLRLALGGTVLILLAGLLLGPIGAVVAAALVVVAAFFALGRPGATGAFAACLALACAWGVGVHSQADHVPAGTARELRTARSQVTELREQARGGSQNVERLREELATAKRSATDQRRKATTAAASAKRQRARGDRLDRQVTSLQRRLRRAQR